MAHMGLSVELIQERMMGMSYRDVALLLGYFSAYYRGHFTDKLPQEVANVVNAWTNFIRAHDVEYPSSSGSS